jgi:hypothetical protein
MRRPAALTASLACTAVALMAAFVVAPQTLAASRSSGGFADSDALSDAFREAFAAYWSSGEQRLTPGLESVVGYWFRYHVAKGVIASVLLIVLVAIGVLLWKAFARAGDLGAGRSAVLASAGVGVTMLAVFSLAAVMANVQGALAPFASLLPMLALDAPALDEIRQQLAESIAADGQTSPALEAMIGDFARYHVALAVVAAIVAAILIGTSIVLWKRFAATPSSARRTRRVLGSFGVLTAVLSLVTIVIAVANTTTAADPKPALLAFFNGGW